ncbi:hypothetical protein D9M71_481530 [compost metagenome]
MLFTLIFARFRNWHRGFTRDSLDQRSMTAGFVAAGNDLDDGHAIAGACDKGAVQRFAAAQGRRTVDLSHTQAVAVKARFAGLS